MNFENNFIPNKDETSSHSNYSVILHNLKGSFPKILTRSPSLENLSEFQKKRSEESDSIISLSGSSKKLNLNPQLNFTTFVPFLLKKTDGNSLEAKNNGKTPYDDISPAKVILSRKIEYKPQAKRLPQFGGKRKNLFDVLSNFYLLKKFVSTLKMSNLRKPKFLGEINFNLIGDSSFDYDEFRTQTAQKPLKMTQKKNICHIFRFMDSLKTFHPFSKFIMVWNLIHLLIFVSLFMIIPINLFFRIDFLEDEIPFQAKSIKAFILSFYFTDIILNFNLSFYDHENLIIDKKIILESYVKTQFYLDIFTLIVLIFWQIDRFYLSDIAIFGFFVKFVKIKKIFKDVEEWLVVNENSYHIYSLLTLLIRILVVSHLAACIWHFIGFFSENSWMASNSLIHQPWHIRYLYSFYFIMITINTVGYGDITPQNSAEVIFCIFFVIIGCMMFAYSLNCMGNIFHAIYKKERQLKEELYIINDFMRSKKIPQDFQMKIRKYLEHIWKEEEKLNLELSMKIFNKLSESLKSTLLIEVNIPTVKKIDLFSLNFSQKTLNGITQIMKEERHPPGEIIFKQGDYRNKDLFYVKKGTVEIFLENETNEKNNYKILKEMNEGTCFGEISFFSEMGRTAGAKCKEYTTLIRFDQNEFKKIIEENEIDIEKFKSIKDKINLYNDYDDLFLKCFSCNQKNHLILNCPLLHCKFFKDIFLRKLNFCVDNKRDYFDRRIKRQKTLYGLLFRPSFFKHYKNTLSEINDHEGNENSQSFSDHEPIILEKTLETIRSVSSNKLVSEEKEISNTCETPSLTIKSLPNINLTSSKMSKSQACDQKEASNFGEESLLKDPQERTPTIREGGSFIFFRKIIKF